MYFFNLYFQIFQANVDLETVVQYSLIISTKARYVQLYPVTHVTFPCMRIELFVRWNSKIQAASTVGEQISFLVNSGLQD